MAISIKQAIWKYKLTQKSMLVYAVLIVASIGTLALLVTHAATPTASFEPESATLSSKAASVNDASASGGKAVRFAAAASHTAPCGWGTAPTKYSHVVWIWMENKDATAVIGKANYIDSIKAACGIATNVQDNATSATLPSEPQYAAATSGSNCNTGINTTGTNCIVNDSDFGSANSLSTTSIFQQVKSAGGTWKSYQESMSSNCAHSSSSPYVYKHNPAAFYTNITTDCQAYDVGMPAITCNSTSSAVCTAPTGSLVNDINSGSLPTFSFITPNLNNDMHDGTVIQADNWLSAYLPLFIAGPNYQSGNTAIFLMWDEGSSNSGSSSTDIPSLFIAPSITPGTSTATQTNNIGLLRTTQEMLGLTPYLGCASGTPPGGVGTCGAGSTTSLRSSLGM